MITELSTLLKESVAFAFQRQHWIRSSSLIAIYLALLLLGSGLDYWLGLDETLSIIAECMASYLLLVLFPIAWYRAVITTGSVEIEYKFSRRTWDFIKKLFQVSLILVLAFSVAFAIWTVAIESLKIPQPLSLSDHFIGWLIYLPFIYLMTRLEFVLPAAATDRPMVLGDAWDASRSIQWPFFGAMTIVWLIGGLVESASDVIESAPAAVEYLEIVAELVLAFVLQALNVTITAHAYKKVFADQ